MDEHGQPIRLVLLDDHDIARGQSIARLAKEPRLDIVGDAADGNGALQLAKTLRPDAVLVETRRLDKRSVEAIAALAALAGERRPAIVAYIEILHRGDWPDARAAGADDLLLKEMPSGTLAGELRRIVDRVREIQATP